MFVVDAYHSNHKPKVGDLFNYFASEFQNILNDGIQINGEIVNVQIRGFICDAPAKSLITGVKNHNAYHGCIQGEYIKNRVTFPDTESILRTNENFRRKLYNNSSNGVIFVVLWKN